MERTNDNFDELWREFKGAISRARTAMLNDEEAFYTYGENAFKQAYGARVTTDVDVEDGQADIRFSCKGWAGTVYMKREDCLNLAARLLIRAEQLTEQPVEQ